MSIAMISGLIILVLLVISCRSTDRNRTWNFIRMRDPSGHGFKCSSINRSTKNILWYFRI